jgi:hypothetical protein
VAIDAHAEARMSVSALTTLSNRIGVVFGL